MTKTHAQLLFGSMVCWLISGTVQLPTKTHPPVWEYTYQYELFEKTYRQTLYLQGELARLRNKLELTKCPTHWITGGEDTCYRLAQHRKLDWFNSQEACERVGGHLAVIDSDKEGELVSALLQNYAKKEQNVLKETWIGGFWSEEHWRWVTGNRLINKPDVGNDTILPTSGSSSTSKRGYCLSWLEETNEVKCNSRLHYLCERKPVSLI